MSLTQIESFVAVAEEGHVGRAARRLHISQPPLTRRIQQLEQELEVALFERTRSGMRLLPAGETLLPHARAILAAVADARAACSHALPGSAGVLEIGVGEGDSQRPRE